MNIGTLSSKNLPENWHQLRPLDRLEHWWTVNAYSFGARAPEYHRLLTDFGMLHPKPQLEDYLYYEFEAIKTYPLKHQLLLHSAFCIMYNTTPTCLALRAAP